jgi:DNA-binding IclR family transcriptional regulator
MAFLPDEEQGAILSGWEQHAGTFAAGHRKEVVRSNLERARLQGYAVNPGLVLEGSYGMGAAVFDQQGRPVGALSLTGIEPRFRPERQEFLGKLLMEEAHRMSAKLPGERPVHAV